MPDYIAVKCFSCGVFQVNQKTKSPKWQCKVCGEKQTLQKVYVIAPKANMVRPYVQDLNMKRGLAEMEAASTPLTLGLPTAASPQQPVAPVHPSESTWRQFDEAPRPVNSAIADLEAMAKEEALCATFGDLHAPPALGRQHQQLSGHEYSERVNTPHSHSASRTYARPVPASTLAPWQRKRQFEPDSPSHIPHPRTHAPVPPRMGIATHPAHPAPARAAPLEPEPWAASARSRVQAVPTHPSATIAAAPQPSIFATYATHAAPEPSAMQCVHGGSSSVQAPIVSTGLSFAGLEEVADAPVAAAQLAAVTVLPRPPPATAPHARGPPSPASHTSLRADAAPHAPRAPAGSIYKRARPANDAAAATAQVSPVRPSMGALHTRNDTHRLFTPHSLPYSSSSSSSPASSSSASCPPTSSPPTNIFAAHARAPTTSPSAGGHASSAARSEWGSGWATTRVAREPLGMVRGAGTQEDLHSAAALDGRTAFKEGWRDIGAAVGDAGVGGQDTLRGGAAARVGDGDEPWGQRGAPAAPAATTAPSAAGGVGDVGGARAHVRESVGLSFMDVPGEEDEEDEEDGGTGGDAGVADGWEFGRVAPADSVFHRALAQSAQPSGAQPSSASHIGPQPRDTAAAARSADTTPTTSAWAAFL